MQNNLYTKIALGVLFVGLQALAAFAAEPDIASKVARAAAAAELQRAENPYEVIVSLHWKKEVTLGDLMLRAPRRPARKDQVIQVKQKDTSCRGVLVKGGERVLMPSSCLNERKYQLNHLTLHFRNGRSVSKTAAQVQVKEEIAWVEVPVTLTAGAPSVVAAAVPAGQSLQAVYGAEMTSHLRSFFHAKKVGPLSRTRPGPTTGRGLLQVGDALIYQGRVVALVKKVVSGYATTFGGVSESAFAVVR